MNARHLRRFLAAVVVALVLTPITATREGRAESTNIVNGDVVSRVQAATRPHGPDGALPRATNTFVGTLASSRQFAAYANDRLLASALCVYAEHVKREWLRLLNTADDWRDPILIVAHSREPSDTNAPAVSLETFQTDEHLEYRIYCLTPPPLDGGELLTTLVEALCAEWANRKQPAYRGRAYAVPRMPPWLVQGMAASIQGRGDRLLAMARRSVAAGRPEDAGELLNTKGVPFDAADRGLFQANAWMFTESLLALPDGAGKLQRFLTELGAQKVVSNAFWMVYREEFPGNEALEKWWSLEQVSRTVFVVAGELTSQETARQLDDILRTRLEAVSGRSGRSGELEPSVDQLWRYWDEPWLRTVLETKSNRLAELRSQAHPLYRPVIDAYSEAVRWLMRQSTVRFRRAIRKAEARRLAAGKQSRAIAAYMDQAERVYAPEDFSLVFAGYFRTLDRFQKLEEERQSPISDYLDKFDQP